MDTAKFICIGGGPSPDLLTNVLISSQSKKVQNYYMTGRSVGKSVSIPIDTLFNLRRRSCKCFKCIQGRFDECSTHTSKLRS